MVFYPVFCEFHTYYFMWFKIDCFCCSVVFCWMTVSQFLIHFTSRYLKSGFKLLDKCFQIWKNKILMAEKYVWLIYGKEFLTLLLHFRFRCTCMSEQGRIHQLFEGVQCNVSIQLPMSMISSWGPSSWPTEGPVLRSTRLVSHALWLVWQSSAGLWWSHAVR